MTEPKFITLEMNHLGPFKDRVKLEEAKIGPLCTTIYARNGSGKSFIGRAFLQIEHFQQGEKCEDIEKLLSFGANDMDFSFSCYKKEENVPADINKFYFSYNQAFKEPKFDIHSNWKVHVFNQDFIEQNIAQSTHTLNSSIDGYIIVGEENIQIDKLKKENQTLQLQYQEISNKIEKEIQTATAELNQNKEFSKLPEFKEIDLERVINNSPENLNFEQEYASWDKLRSFNEEQEKLETPIVEIPENLLLMIPGKLTQKIIPSAIDAVIKEKLSENSSFFEQGTKLWKSNTHICPFCNQKLQEEALKLIKIYNDYFNDEEAKLGNSLMQSIEDVKRIKKTFLDIETALVKLEANYQTQASYFSVIKDKQLKSFKDFARLQGNLDQLLKLIEEKNNNKEKTDFPSDAIISIVIDDYKALQKHIIDIGLNVKTLEGIKGKLVEQKKNARKNVCKALICKLHEDNNEDIKRLGEFRATITTNQEQIKNLQSKVKLSKKDEVQKLFKNLLVEFFGDHYTYDEISGKLKYKGSIELDSVKHVISDGEKSVIAFAHYIALIHKIVNTKDDYKNLFLVIDDPISSMDFNFIYQVCHVIRYLEDFIPNIHGRVRFLILTHNQEFTNILLCNNIACSAFCIEEGIIKKLATSFVLPYDAHLRHIYKVSQGKANPSFHTPNSMRHVLETINSFKYPRQSFLEGLLSEPFFAKEKIGELYLLVQDLSHGRFRSSELYSDKRIKDLTILIMKYIEGQFNGQFKFIESQEKDSTN